MHGGGVRFFIESSAPDNWQEGFELTQVIRKQLGLRAPTAGRTRFGYWWQVGMTQLIALFGVVFIWQGA